MKYCKKCGNKMVDDAVVCVKCGSFVNKVSSKHEKQKFCSCCGFSMPIYAKVCLNCGTSVIKDVKTQKSYSTALVSTIKAFLILACILKSSLVGLLWMLPMTIALFEKMNKGEPIGVGFKICTLIFVSLFAGILLLCLGDPEEKND